MGKFNRKQIRKFNGHRYVYDRCVSRKRGSKKRLQKIANCGLKNKVFKSYRIVSGKKAYYLYIKP